MKAAIAPSIVSNKNKEIAILIWNRDKDKEIIRAMNKGKSIFSCARFGIDSTPYGKICWALFCVDIYSKLKHQDDGLFFFDLILDLSDNNYRDFALKWLDMLSKQNELNLYVKIDGVSRRHPILQHHQIKEWYDLINQWLVYLDNNCFNYAEANKFIYINHLNQLKRNIASELIAKANTPKNKYDELMMLISHYIENYNPSKEVINTFRLIVEQFKDNNQLKLPVSLVGDDIIWRTLEINSPEPQLTELNMIVQTAPAYSYLLDGSRWDKILNTYDILIPRIHEFTISSLCDIPNREAFDNCSKILAEAVDNREFSINEPTSIVINKQGLEEIVFYPQTKSGLECLMKFVFSYNVDSNPHSCLVIVGKINAKDNIVEIKGEYPGFDIEIKILKFLATVAYRDILVARKVLRKDKFSPQSGTGFGKKFTRTNNHIRYVSRIKHDREFNSDFANPKKISEAIKEIKPHLRQCHKRKLPLGHQASEKAKQLASEYEYLLPEGYTFVAESKIGKELNNLKKEFKSISLIDLLFHNS